MSNDITITNASELDTMAKAIIEDIAEPGLALTPELIEEGKHLLEALNLARTELAASVEKLFETVKTAGARPLLGSQVVWYHAEGENLTPYLGIITAIEKDVTGMPGELVEVNVLGYRRPLEYTRCAIGTKPGDNVAVFHALPTT